MLTRIKSRLIGPDMQALIPSFRALSWASITHIGLVGLGLIQHVLLAKWLGPQVWAVFGLAIGFTAVLKALTAFELDQAWIAGKASQDDVSALATIWFTEILRRCFLAAVLFFSAPLFAQIWSESELVLVLKIIAIGMVVEGFESARILKYQRSLDFFKIGVYQLLTKTLVTITAIFLAVWLGQVWTLAFAYLCHMVLKASISQIWFPYWPGWFWNRAVFRELWSFAKHIPSIGFAIVLLTVGSEWLIGWIANFQILGSWLFASTLVMLPYHFTVQAVSVVGLAAFGNHRKTVTHLPFNLAQAICLVAMGLAIIYLVLTIIGSSFLIPLLGPDWRITAELLPILAIMGLFRCWSQLFTLSFFGMQQPSLEPPIIWAEVILVGVTLSGAAWLYSFQSAILATSWVFVFGFCVRWRVFHARFNLEQMPPQRMQ